VAAKIAINGINAFIGAPDLIPLHG
jgi:hypothetical protein